MSEEVLRGRIIESTYDPMSQRTTHVARAVTLTGKEFHARFAVNKEAGGFAHGKRVMIDVAGWVVDPETRDRFELLEIHSHPIPGEMAAALYGPSNVGADEIPMELRRRAHQRASRYGLVVNFTLQEGSWMIVVQHGRGEIRRKILEGEKLEDILTSIGLGATA